YGLQDILIDCPGTMQEFIVRNLVLRAAYAVNAVERLQVLRTIVRQVVIHGVRTRGVQRDGFGTGGWISHQYIEASRSQELVDDSLPGQLLAVSVSSERRRPIYQACTVSASREPIAKQLKAS